MIEAATGGASVDTTDASGTSGTLSLGGSPLVEAG
jgi:hypothetical protein